MGTGNGSGSSKHQATHPKATSNNDNPLIQGNILHTSSSSYPPSPLSSSSSLASCSNPSESDMNDKNGLEPSAKIEQDDLGSPTAEWSMMSTSPRTRNSSLTAFPTVSPPVQLMGRFTAYDSKRIPSSVFAPKPAAASAVDWSVASNESLFSIHMGNNSFSREFNMFKSGELKIPEEWMNSGSGLPPKPETKPNDLPSLPVVIEAPSGNSRKSTSSIGRDFVENEEAYETGKVESTRHDDKEKLNSANASPLSDVSCQSNKSFAFPLLGGETPTKGTPDKFHSQSERPEAAAQVSDETKGYSCFCCSALCR